MKFVTLAAVLCISGAAFAQRYSQTNLVSDIAGLAAHTDSRLVNPWGISFGPTPFWIADNGTGLTTLYEPDGSAAPFLQNGVVIPPPAGGSGSTPTGTVFDGTGQFVISETDSPAALFSYLRPKTAQSAAGARQSTLTTRSLPWDNSASGAVYKGLASAQIGSANFLYATNLHDNTVEMYDSGFNQVNTFSDPNVPPAMLPLAFALSTASSMSLLQNRIRRSTTTRPALTTAS
jgi:uncharacterized protein (TIGR03118 family)